MARDGTDVHQVLDAWRAEGIDRSDPVRFHHVAALQRRASCQQGEAKRLLERRLSDLTAAGARHRASGAPAVVLPPTPSPLGELVDLLNRQSASHAVEQGDLPTPAVFPDMPALQAFRRIWSDLRARSQLQASLQATPTEAGPLNSGKLIHRMLTLMQDVSPEYLRQFLSYADVLSCLEQMNGGTPQKAPGSAARKRAER